MARKAALDPAYVYTSARSFSATLAVLSSSGNTQRFNCDEPEDMVYGRFGQTGFKRPTSKTWKDAAQRWDARPNVAT
ncbi:hypothetical protein EBF16_09670 [Sphingobium yanoikuyae]|uniref:Uncharacterized protein n=1 Tax=Sphingobium yanoikuyae TaxID=13690 RepID=A0A3G2UPV5_SPHYA|nr:hypothetical protein EBF16_09670 [Sphingobium yanoikuyae]